MKTRKHLIVALYLLIAIPLGVSVSIAFAAEAPADQETAARVHAALQEIIRQRDDAQARAASLAADLAAAVLKLKTLESEHGKRE